MLRRRRQAGAIATGLVLAVTALLAPGCSGDDEGSIPTTTSPRRTSSSAPDDSTTTTSTTAAPEATTEDEVANRYRAFWDARFEANEDPPDPEHPGLREYATGPQLDNVLAETSRNRDQGLAFRRPSSSVYERRVRVVRVDAAGGTAALQDCVTNDGIVYRVSTGEVLDDSVGTRSLEAVMRLVDGEWRVESTRVLQEWEGVAGCAVAAG